VGHENPWLDIGCWRFHQALWGIAKKNYAEGIYVFDRSEVNIEVFLKFLRENLKVEGWEEQKEIFDRMNPRYK